MRSLLTARIGLSFTYVNRLSQMKKEGKAWNSVAKSGRSLPRRGLALYPSFPPLGMSQKSSMRGVLTYDKNFSINFKHFSRSGLAPIPVSMSSRDGILAVESASWKADGASSSYTGCSNHWWELNKETQWQGLAEWLTEPFSTYKKIWRRRNQIRFFPPLFK